MKRYLKSIYDLFTTFKGILVLFITFTVISGTFVSIIVMYIDSEWLREISLQMKNFFFFNLWMIFVNIFIVAPIFQSYCFNKKST